jgi:uncharacterized protein YidB (DUF937 family)
MEDNTNPLTSAAGGDPAAAATDPAAAGTDPAAAVSGLDQAIQSSGGLDGLVTKLRAGGLGDEVDSWVSTGPNAEVEPERLASALGPDTVQHLSAGSGLHVSQLLPMLAMFLPQIINALTPNGHVPSGGLNGATGGGLGDLGGILGGLLGGGSASGSPDLGGLLGGMLGGNKPR